MKREDIKEDHWASEVVSALNSRDRDSREYNDAVRRFWDLVNVEVETDQDTGKYTLRTSTDAGTLAKSVDPAFLGRLTEGVMHLAFETPLPRFLQGYFLGGSIKEQDRD